MGGNFFVFKLIFSTNKHILIVKGGQMKDPLNPYPKQRRGCFADG